MNAAGSAFPLYIGEALWFICEDAAAYVVVFFRDGDGDIWVFVSKAQGTMEASKSCSYN